VHDHIYSVILYPKNILFRLKFDTSNKTNDLDNDKALNPNVFRDLKHENCFYFEWVKELVILQDSQLPLLSLLACQPIETLLVFKTHYIFYLFFFIVLILDVRSISIFHNGILLRAKIPCIKRKLSIYKSKSTNNEY